MKIMMICKQTQTVSLVDVTQSLDNNISAPKFIWSAQPRCWLLPINKSAPHSPVANRVVTTLWKRADQKKKDWRKQYSGRHRQMQADSAASCHLLLFKPCSPASLSSTE